MSDIRGESAKAISASRTGFDLWVHPDLAPGLPSESEAAYDRLARLQPADHFVEKQGRSTGRFQIEIAGEAVAFFLKRYPNLSWWRRRLSPLGTFPGPHESANLRAIAALGIAVPETLAVGSSRSHPCASFFATRELCGYLPLHEFIPAALHAARPTLLRSIATRLAQITRSLHAARLYHRDLYLCHFFARFANDGAVDLVLIDLARLKHSRWPRWRVKDLAQLLFSSDLPGITRTDRLRFFLRYLPIGRLDTAARRVLARVTAKAERYRRHNEKHRRVPVSETAAER